MTDQSNPQLIDKPKNAAKPKGPEPEIFVMPAKYRGAVLRGEGVKTPAKPAPPTPAPAPVPPPAKKPAPPVKAAEKKLTPPAKKKGFPVKLVVIGIIIIALFAAAAIIVLSTLNQPTDEPEVTTPVTPPITTPDEEEDEEPEEVPPVEEDPDTEDPFATDFVPGTDTDSDGLTDIEESLYGTNPQLPDSDEDGFLDGNEVFHRYNPNGTAPGSLFESGLIRVFDDPAFSYTIFYPTVWNARAVGGEEEQVIFTATSGEIVQVIVSAKSADQTVTEWFMAQDGQVSEDELLAVETKEGLIGIMSPDRLTAYLDAGDRVYVVSYSVGTKPTVDYLQTFQMMLNSLVVR